MIRPEVENPLSLNALGGTLSGSGFADPYAQAAGVTPKPAATAGGYDWCNPEPIDYAPAQLGKTGLPTAMRMVRPPYSKVYCAWAAVLAKRNAAVANSFLISVS